MPPARCYRLVGDVEHHLGGRYPSFIAHTGSRANPKPSCSLWLLASFGRSLQVAVSPCWEWDLPDVISACLSPRAWTPIPAALEVRVPVSSLEASAFPPLGRVGAQRLTHALRLRHGPTFGSAVIPLCSGPRVARHPGRSYRRAKRPPWAAVTYYVRAEHDSLPPRASDMLAG